MKINNCIKLGGLAVIAIATLSLCFSCRKAAEKATEKMIEKSIKKSTGEDVDIDFKNQKTVVESEDGRFEVDVSTHSWPAEIPATVPEFKYGEVTSVTTNETAESRGWTIILKDVPGDATEKYGKELKGKGFKTQTVNMSGMGGTISAEKDNLVVAVMSAEQGATVSVQVKKD
jgi:hypothetical protein